MQIDWTTFVLEIVNFLALVWILKRFLYQPVLDILAQRRASVERTLAQAREAEERATALKAQFENRLADWEKEKAAARAQFEAGMAAELASRMQALSETLAEERARSAAQEAHRQEELRRDTESRAMAQGRAFASALLSRLAGPDLERLLVDLLAEDFSSLPEDRLAGLRAVAETQAARAIVTSAFPLPEAQCNRIGEIIADRLGLAIPLDFMEDANLLAGLRISIGAWQLKASLADELAYFAGAAHHAE